MNYFLFMLANVKIISEIALLIVFIASFIVAIFVLLENRNPIRASALILLLFTLPGVGLIIYFYIGRNYRKKRMFEIKKDSDRNFIEQLLQQIRRNSENLIRENQDLLGNKSLLAKMLLNDNYFGLSDQNSVKLLVNGEEKFPELFHDLENAKHHIHIEYFIIENGLLFEQLKEILSRKSKEGVSVRIIYDDFGSRRLKNKSIKSLQNAGIEILPFYKTYFPSLANRINYRNHRKIVIIDGKTGYTGGLNMSDKYTNDFPKKNNLFWRDTHLKIKGTAIRYLQYTFLLDWQFCSDQTLYFNTDFFPSVESNDSNKLVQIISGGPDLLRETVMMTYFKAIVDAEKECFITTPYLIPNQGIITALKQAALGGVDVRILIPGISDSWLLNSATNTFLYDLLFSGVKIYQYQKGFIHAKTISIDQNLSIIGSANMDYRSFDYNFEANAIVYDRDFNNTLKEQFLKDLEESTQISIEDWIKRPLRKRLIESVVRLLSPVL
ncbi:MAG: cardiolipin synthase [Bacteroidetes bacterium]|nr:cardiolipin synthase [Bacteroidota bacterium]